MKGRRKEGEEVGGAGRMPEEDVVGGELAFSFIHNKLIWLIWFWRGIYYMCQTLILF
jgi:hypothetical protein